jgi:hypothetical protein
LTYIDQVDVHETAPDLAESLDAREVSPDALVLLLRNRLTPSATILRIGRNRSWMRFREVRLAFVSCPRAPQVLARQLLPHLGWRDLAQIPINLAVSPVLRREAEKLLKVRLPELALGEKVALARRGSRGVIEMLCGEVDAIVLRAVAGNPRTTEADLARILVRSDAPGEFLGWLADQSSWGRRRELRLALVRHPRTPASSALRLARELSPHDLDRLRRDGFAPRLVRIAAERRLSTAGAGDRGSRIHVG